MGIQAGAGDLAGTYDARSHVYRNFGNGSLVELVRSLLPAGGAVLDVGCASGGLLAALRDSAGYTAGIEISQTAARSARRVADHVVVGDITDPHLDPGPVGFDVVVLADVVEHVVDPLPVVRRAGSWCDPAGVLVISVPNIAFWKARARLGRGRWEYEDSGTFDRGHLRFFTRATILTLVQEAGLEVEAVVPVVPALRNHAGRLLIRAPNTLAARAELAWQALGRRRPELMAFQFLVVARPPRAA